MSLHPAESSLPHAFSCATMRRHLPLELESLRMPVELLMRFAVSALSLLVVACVSTHPSITPQPCPTAGVAEPPAPAGLTPPAVTHMPELPLPAPLSVRQGAPIVIRAVVDTSGRAFPDSVTVCGVEDIAFASRIAERIVSTPFRPATLGGRHVVWPTLIELRYGRGAPP